MRVGGSAYRRSGEHSLGHRSQHRRQEVGPGGRTAAERDLIADPPASLEDQQVALQRVRALQAQAQIYATLEVARQVENVETSMPGPLGL